jgi:uncharacterized protein
MFPSLAPWQWMLGGVVAFLVGVAKTGVPGLGILVVPLMALAAGDVRQSAGWLLPILCTADIFAVVYWRRHAAANRLFALAPWVLAGMAGGAAALSLSERVLRPVVGGIVLVMLLAFFWRKFRPAAHPELTHAGPYGVSAGFATTVANAAGPVMNLYLLSMRLPKDEFIATGAWFFFLINLAKLPIYAWHGMIGRSSLLFDLALVPAVVGGSLAGLWLAHRLPQRVFDWLVILLTAGSALLLFR